MSSKDLNLISGKNRLRARAFPLPQVEPLEFLWRLGPEEYPVFLDSVTGPSELASFSFLAWNPFACLTSSQGRSVATTAEGLEIPYPDNPFEALGRLLALFEIERSGIETPFAGGGIGWFSYELGRWIERLPSHPPDRFGLPELWLGLYDSLVVFDHRRGKTFAILSEFEGNPYRSGDSYLRSKLEEVKGVLKRPKKTDGIALLGPARSDHSRESFCEAVRKAKEYIFAGDIYQVNLSQRFDIPIEGNSVDLYSRLRKTNPAPFAAFLSTPHGDVLSSSPELFLRIRDRFIETRPIKGTRPRVGDSVRDAKSRAELLSSKKDHAELTMIVDLERNDLKKVCQTGTVHVPRLYGLEEYETVFHLVATIQGRLRQETSLVQCLEATFPGGSITGAPKIRSQEIIAELEHSARSVYTGSIGWIGFDGDAELNIAIRTLLRKGKIATYRVGGGIVADSDPDAEYEETLHKGRGLSRALGLEK